MRGSKGQIFLYLLWIFIFLVAVVLGLVYRSSQEMKMTSASWDRSRAYFITWTALQEVIRILNSDDTAVDSYKDSWAKGDIKGTTQEGKWNIDLLYDTERYVNINKAGPVILKRIYGQLPAFLDSLLDWLDADSSPRPLGAEDDYYNNQGFDYECRDGEMKNLFELGMIRGGEQIIKPPAGINSKFSRNYNLDRYVSSFAIWNNPFLKAVPLEITQRGYPSFLSGLADFLFNQGTAYADGGCGHGSCDPDQWPYPYPWPNPWPWPVPGPAPGPRPSPAPPNLPEPPPKGPPFNPPEPDPRGEGVTVYGDGRVNINTALPQVLMALGLQKETVRRIIWYRIYGNVFPSADANTLIQELIRKGWLKPREVLYQSIVNNIKTAAGKLKANSSDFFVKITSVTSKGALHKAIAVVERGKDKNRQTNCRVIAWWEWIF